MSEILLVRHGKVMRDHVAPIRGNEFRAWAQSYGEASLDDNSKPPQTLIDQVAATKLIATSTLRRSIESAALLAPGRPVISEPDFNEAGVPTGFTSPLRLRPERWDVLARTAWFFGWSAGAESFRAATKRAEKAADKLVTLVAEQGAVTLVGHGMLNTLIGRALRQRGWSGMGAAREYWGVLRMRRIKTD